uniref:Zinc finger FYVE domain-containing protein n=1 Tax=Arion vulgaris TaxID=1028688 RepID=A0A0B6ZSS3_9EUPU
MCFIDPVRHCKNCAVISQKENEFFDKHLTTLMGGGKFQLQLNGSIDNISNSSDSRACNCALSIDHRYLEFKGDTHGQENVAIEKIVSVENTGTEQDQLNKGIAIQYKNPAGKTTLLEMTVDSRSGHRQQTMSWIFALLKAFKMIRES